MTSLMDNQYRQNEIGIWCLPIKHAKLFTDRVLDILFATTRWNTVTNFAEKQVTSNCFKLQNKHNLTCQEFPTQTLPGPTFPGPYQKG